MRFLPSRVEVATGALQSFKCAIPPHRLQGPRARIPKTAVNDGKLLQKHARPDGFLGFPLFLSDRSVFVPSDKCAENTAIARKIKRKQVRKRLIIRCKISVPQMSKN